MVDLLTPKMTEQEGVNHFEVTGTLLIAAPTTCQWVHFLRGAVCSTQ
jgi:hypothetical protein